MSPKLKRSTKLGNTKSFPRHLKKSRIVKVSKNIFLRPSSPMLPQVPLF